MICKKCGQNIPISILKAKAKQKSKRVSEALQMAKSLGEPVGRPKEFSKETIVTLRSDGLSSSKISKIVGCSIRTVQRYLGGV